MTKTFPEVISGIRTAKKGVEVREDIAQMGEYVEQFAATATQKADAAAASEKKASDAVANIDQQKADSVAAVQQAQTTATTAITQTKDAALTDIGNAKTGALQEVANSTATAETAASAAAGSASDANASKEAAATSAAAAAGSASAASTSETNSSASASAAATSEANAKKYSEEAGAKANTDKTLSIENAPADAAAVRKLIEESLAAQRAEDYARIKFWASNDPTSPASFIGGTWERIEGEFIMGASSAYPVGTTGGSATHTQTVAEMPSHNHSGSTGSAGSHSHSAWTGGAGGHSHTVSAAVTQKYEVNKLGASGADGSGTYGYTFSSGTATTSWVRDHTHDVGMNEAGAHTHTVSIGSTGSGQAMSVLNPYHALYIWVRVDDAA